MVCCSLPLPGLPVRGVRRRVLGNHKASDGDDLVLRARDARAFRDGIKKGAAEPAPCVGEFAGQNELTHLDGKNYAASEHFATLPAVGVGRND